MFERKWGKTKCVVYIIYKLIYYIKLLFVKNKREKKYEKEKLLKLVVDIDAQLGPLCINHQFLLIFRLLSIYHSIP